MGLIKMKFIIFGLLLVYTYANTRSWGHDLKAVIGKSNPDF